MRVRDALDEAARRLRAAGADAPRLCARLCACRVLDCPREALELAAERELSREEESAFNALADRRALGEPLALILGEKEFYGRAFTVTRDTLIPRPESELLVDLALARLPADRRRIADLGAGTGCLGLSLCAERPAWRALLFDLSLPALRVAAHNLERHSLRGRALPVLGDFRRPLLRAGTLDGIVSNPPYVAEAEYAGLDREVRDFEPRGALVPAVSAADGLECLRAVAAAAQEALAAGGRLFVEFGAGQGAAVREIFTLPALADLRIHKDLAGLERCLEAVRI